MCPLLSVIDAVKIIQMVQVHPLVFGHSFSLPAHHHAGREINANTNSSVLISYLEANSGAPMDGKVWAKCALDRAISKLPFELVIRPSCLG